MSTRARRPWVTSATRSSAPTDERWLSIAAFTALGLTSLAMLSSINLLSGWLKRDELPGRRVRRLRLRQMGSTVGLWQIAVGACIITLGGVWPVAIAPIGMGLMFLAGARLSKRYPIPPWWAPED